MRCPAADTELCKPLLDTCYHQRREHERVPQCKTSCGKGIPPCRPIDEVDAALDGVAESAGEMAKAIEEAKE